MEDEPALRSLALYALKSKGYTVLPAADGEEALRMCQAHEGAIDLLVSDVVMPRLGGGAARGIGSRGGLSPEVFHRGRPDPEDEGGVGPIIPRPELSETLVKNHEKADSGI